MAKIGLILLSYRADPTPLFDSIAATRHAVTWYAFFHGSDPALRATLDDRVHRVAARYFPYGVNRGLARSWNDGLIASFSDGNEATILLNDDLFFYEDGFDSFVEFVMSCKEKIPDFATITVHGRETGSAGDLGSGRWHGKSRAQDAACMAIGQNALEQIGFFDQNFWPAYFEDIDYLYRLALARLPMLCDTRVLLEHKRSSTARTDQLIRLLHGERLRRNEAYYVNKWGGPFGREMFDRPFNDNRLSTFISEDRRAAPFGQQYDRSDLNSSETQGLLEKDFTEELFSMLRRCRRPTRRYLEWSTGEPTAVAAEYARAAGTDFFLSIDHAADRLRETAARLPKYPFLHLRFVGLDGADDGDSAYAHYPLHLGIKFDVILVAGGRKSECALVAAKLVAPDGIVIVRRRNDGEEPTPQTVGSGHGTGAVLDGWRRIFVDALLQVYDLVDETHQLSVFRLKSQTR